MNISMDRVKLVGIPGGMLKFEGKRVFPGRSGGNPGGHPQKD